MTPQQIAQKKSEIKTKSAIYGLLVIGLMMFSLCFFAEHALTNRDILNLLGLAIILWLATFKISRLVLYQRNGFTIERPPSP